MTVDGFVAGPEGQLDWMLKEVDDRQVEYLNQITSTTDTILLGRKMAMEAVPHWEAVAASETGSPEVEYARFFVDTHKIIFSKSLERLEGKNCVLEHRDLNEVVSHVKSGAGKDIIVYGGAQFVSSLIQQKLIDELILMIHPVVIGNGLSIFKERAGFELTRSDHYGNGIVLLQYEMMG